MAQKIYVGNLNYQTTDETLSSLFGQYGEVISATVIKDRYSDQSKGFGFVEMTEKDAADAAIATLNGKEVDGRRIRVNIAEDKPRTSRPRGSYGGGREGDSGGGYNNYRY
ncbi:RNA recognition motif domain-containing protein [Treponema endosymbiont of Eucomonympha sp.]|uniref:RNA recognition motif domain-containing protein n=1 Tax=Treponema endosymbiont of Eucomonympha sp. TaxID=1580831 RepID=UPI0007818389|nr:RNA-binding protein [Treponema endosymbiont of Eucomonympha sp.]